MECVCLARLLNSIASIFTGFSTVVRIGIDCHTSMGYTAIVGAGIWHVNCSSQLQLLKDDSCCDQAPVDPRIVPFFRSRLFVSLHVAGCNLLIRGGV